MAKQQGGYEKVGCLEKDIRNHVDKDRRLYLESGDANAMLECFMLMQEENSRFFYAVDLDDDGRLKNVFWVDANGRNDYQDFRDSRLLGCALLANGFSDTFIWLMKTWLREMGGKPPNVIIIDQDRAMKVAIKEVFPNVRHRFCLWHILRKVPEKLSHVIRKHEDFVGYFNTCIYKSRSIQLFKDKWKEMIEKFQLSEDGWIQSLYE
ncbi:protein FAR-RED IMPAIRED RESPONSE 1-like [Vicia villosa]|uniref:protein FAR-RED IMPAIRED RESPONSE 1-like n=1 Tax=Vicia villosa TaxID=3911 RepID=UPI00273C8649|nr:protein FAR-RED IMPAIRED RESPONSE 1-like [Vicia villosa]